MESYSNKIYIIINSNLYWIIFIAGTLSGYIVKNFISKYLNGIYFSLKTSFYSRKESGKQHFLTEGQSYHKIRYVHDGNSVGAAMLEQYKGARGIILFVGDFSFLRSDANLKLYDYLMNISEQPANLIGTITGLHIVSSRSIEYFSEMAKNEDDKKIHRLVEKLNRNKQFIYKPNYKFRGSYVEYDSVTTIYKSEPVPNNENGWPAIIISLSNSASIRYGGQEKDLGVIINYIASINRDLFANTSTVVYSTQPHQGN